jgi:autotransporter-associated beta strand protein
LAAVLAGGLVLAPAISRAQTIQSYWAGGTSADWSVDGNWSPSGVPDGVVTAINIAAGNLATVSSAVSQQPSWLVVGNGAAGTMNLVPGGSLSVAGEMDVGNGNGGTGVFNMSGGSLTVNGWLEAGRLGGTTASGTWNLTGGTLTQNGNGGNFDIGEGTGVFNVSNATVNITAGELWVGPGGNGTLTLANGGAITCNDWVVVGRTGGTGVMNLSGGTFTHGGANNFVLGNGTGTVNQSGGTFSLTTGDLRITESGTGLYNLTGGTANVNTILVGSQGSGSAELRIGGSGVMTAGAVVMGNAGSMTSVVNLNGGILQATAITFGSSIGAATFNFNGGTLRAGAAGAIMSGLSVANVRNGGAVIDDGGYAIAMAQALVHSSIAGDNAIDGGLTKIGNGTLELSGTFGYTGPTTVNAGTLQLDVPGSSQNAFRLAKGAMLNLNFTGTNVVAACYTNGVQLPLGTYNAGNLPGFITGSGNLTVSSSISTGHWTGGGANNNWSTAGNWDQDVVPVFPIGLTFTGATRLVNTNDLPGIALNSLTFDAAAGAFVLDGNDIALDGKIGFNGNPAAPVTQTVNLNLTWTGSETIDTPTNGNLTLGGNITSFTDTSLIKLDGGTLTLGGTNELLSWDLNGGTTTLTGSTTINGDSSSRVYVGDGDATNGCRGTLVIQPGAALTVNGNFADSMVIGRDSGSGTVVQNGGTFTFNPVNITYLFVGASSSAATRAEYDMNGGTLDMGGYTLAAALAANNATLITGLVSQVAGTITNVGELNLGAFTLGPGHGIYNLIGGSIYLGAAGIQSDSGVYEVHLGGGTVGAYASWSSPLNMNLTGSNGPVTFDTAGNSITLSGILSGNGGLNVVGGGTLELSGANSYAGDTTVTAGGLQLDTTGSSSGSFRVANGANLNLNYSGTFVVSRCYTNGVAVLNGTYNSANLPDFISGSGNLQVIGAISRGHWTGLGANNNWSMAGNWDTGTEPIFPIDLAFAGSVRLDNTNDLTSITANSLTFDAAAGPFVLNGNSLGLNGDIRFNGNPAAPVTETINLPLAPAANINVDTPANGELVINGDINAATNTVYKVDDGTLILGGTNTFAGYDVDGGTNVISGNTTVAGTGSTRAYVANADHIGGSVGTLIIPNGGTFNISGSFGDAYVIGRDGGQGRLIQNGGAFTFNPFNQTWIFVGAGNNPSTRGEYDMNGGLLDMNGLNLGLGLGVGVAVTGIVNQVSGVITNVGQLFLNPIFNGGYGIYNLTGGSLYLGSGGMAFNSGGGYQLNFGGGTIGAEANWSSALNITLTGNHGPVTFNPAGNTITLSGALTGSGGLTVAGSGIVDLAGPNSYTGPTTVNGGTLELAQPTLNANATVAVASGALLQLDFAGTNTVSGLVLNGVAQLAGVYNHSTTPGYFTAGSVGSLQVASAIPSTPTDISYSVSGGRLTLSWPASYQAWTLQEQTNSLSKGLGTNWVDIGALTGTTTNVPLDAAPAVFYRLRHP